MAKKKKKTEIFLTPEQQREADYQKAVRRMEGAEKMLQAEDKVHMYREAIRMFEELGDYEDCEVRKKRCRKRLALARREHREEVYQEGMRLKSEAESAAGYEAAVAEFRRLRREYKDIPKQIQECERLKENAQKKERRKALAGKFAAAAVLAAVIAAAVFLCSPAAFYLEGSFLMSIQDYERADTLFAKSRGYKDTEERVLECRYQRALKAAQNGEYKKAVGLLYKKTGDYKDALEKKAEFEKAVLARAGIGDTVIFGDVRWIVADVTKDTGKKLLLVRKKPAKAETVYQVPGKEAVWKESNMRAWLNRDFFDSCFSEYEQQDILETKVVTKANSVYGTGGGEDTQDQVFLLDEAQAQQYGEILNLKENQKAWWLRTPGKMTDSAAFVMGDGTVMRYGCAADSMDISVRPAVWVRSGDDTESIKKNAQNGGAELRFTRERRKFPQITG